MTPVRVPYEFQWGGNQVHKLFMVSVIKGAALALALFACVFVFRLGFFIPFVVVLGALFAGLLSVGEQRASRNRVPAVPVAVISYALATTALYWGLTSQVSHRTFEMTWHDLGSGNPSGESEVVLDFVQFPGNSVGIYSTALRDYLSARGKGRAEVKFEVVSDVWCVRGFHEERIGDLTDLGTLEGVGGYARSVGNASSPWGPRHWWCR